MSTLGLFTPPVVQNEPLRHYAPGSPERAGLQSVLTKMQQSLPFEVPCIVNGKPVKSSSTATQVIPHDHAKHLCTYHEADESLLNSAISDALAAKKEWESMPWNDRAAIFLKAAELVSGKYRYEIMAATMLGQGKNAWQAEIDAAAELVDFLRFGVHYVEEIYKTQPPRNAAGVWNRTEYRPLEGFVFAVTPFNFTAIGGNLCFVPAILGNVVVWKPSPGAVYANYITHKIFLEAGVPPSVIQFLPCTNDTAPSFVAKALSHPSFAGLHFTGSTHVFRSLYKEIAIRTGEGKYKGYPRVVGETGGKNWHLVHESAEVKNAVNQSVRAAFEYQGQKCSALSRVYVSSYLWNKQGGFKDLLLAEIKKIKVGSPIEWENFMGPVAGKPAYTKSLSYIQKAKDEGGEILCGGTGDDSKGYYVQPTVILTKDPKSLTMREEIFGPVLTIYVYEDTDFEKTLDLIDETSEYGLTGSIFTSTRSVLIHASHRLINAAGNIYYNEKCTGAVVGQQPFGGSRASGTCDKAGSGSIFGRFLSARSVKENFVGLEGEGVDGGWGYPSNLV
ncbi:delta-1-pyrroline-5-carboxylate dehydrogenase [Dendrothele bispora CBS 962.96]|uniref:Multifunctional fusion protein n=1 Tax=Dendrothele bispora (strain CBS 962.96) TaxID=1314807 RepID=A0A4S8MKN9_DENBC|nr:delta-1-pyrroline-5-carboxylate dehydrogenase [Dendrothele bispora CBS 962.96]